MITRGQPFASHVVTNAFKSNAMITSRPTTGLLCSTTFLTLGMIFQATVAVGANRDIPRAKRSKPVNRTARTVAPQSYVAQAATGRAVNTPIEAPLDGSLVDGELTPVGFIHLHRNDCGPVCDCSRCESEPVCGIEEIYDPSCGSEGELFLGCQGCDAGCSECFETSCGIEEIVEVGCGTEFVEDCSCDACNPCQGDTCLPMLRFSWSRFEFFSGAQGFKGPLNYVSTDPSDSSDRSGASSFGFFQGFNHSKSLKRSYGIGLATQFGARATQNNLSGAGFTTEHRYQVFVTGGIFRRVDYGLQGGLVMDYLNQDWYFQGHSLQLRGELSWRTEACNTFGFQFMAGVRNENSSTTVQDVNGNALVNSITIEPTDQYRLFFRRPIARSGECSLFAGWTDHEDGLLGGSMNLPIHRFCSLSTGMTYLIPHEGKRNGGNEQESWNLSMGLVFRPGGPQGCGRYCRPLFDVADNGSFLLDTK